MAIHKRSSTKSKHNIGFWVFVAAIILSVVLAYNYAKTETSPSSASVIGLFGQYYIATDGNDLTGNGSYSNPLRTINKAISLALPNQVTYIYPKGNLLLSPMEYPQSSVTVISGGKDIRITRPPALFSLVTPSISAAEWAGSFVIEVRSASLAISQLGFDRVRWDLRAGENSRIEIIKNRLFYTQPKEGEQSLPGKILVRTAHKSSVTNIAENQFLLADLRAECCSVNGLQIMHQQTGIVNVTKNLFQYPYVNKRLGPKLEYEGIMLWRNAAGSGEGVNIAGNIFNTLGFSPLGPKTVQDFGIALAGAKNITMFQNDFSRFLGTPVRP